MKSNVLRSEKTVGDTDDGLENWSGHIDAGYHQYLAEFKILTRAIDGDLRAILTILRYLNSSHSDIRRMMQQAIHNYPDQRLWRLMLNYYALDAWVDFLRITSDQVVAQRLHLLDGYDNVNLYQSIAEVFAVDQNELEGELKEIVISDAIRIRGEQRIRIRHAAGIMLGLRGSVDAISILDEILELDTLDDHEQWSIRAVQSLAAIYDPKCGSVLIKALAMGRGELHRSATRALADLGMKVEAAWLEALEHPDSHIRWHAARALGQCGDFRGIEVLASGLLDKSHTVRWATAGVLANLGSPVIPAILDVIVNNPIDEPFRRTIYHALHGIQGLQTQEYLSPLLLALCGSSARVEAPAIAQRMLAEWKRE